MMKNARTRAPRAPSLVIVAPDGKVCSLSCPARRSTSGLVRPASNGTRLRASTSTATGDDHNVHTQRPRLLLAALVNGPPSGAWPASSASGSIVGAEGDAAPIRSDLGDCAPRYNLR